MSAGLWGCLCTGLSLTASSEPPLALTESTNGVESAFPRPDAVSGESQAASPGEDPKARQEIGTSVDQIGASLDDTLEDKKSVFGSLVTGPVREAWTDSQRWLDEKLGLRLGVFYNSLVQYASEAPGDQLASAGEFQVKGRLRLWGKESGNLGFVDLQIRNRHRYGDIPPSSLGQGIGSLWPTVRGFNNAGWQVPDFYFEQYLLDRRFGFRGGQTRIDNLFDSHALRSARLFFLNSAFSDNPAVAFPSFGPGAVVELRPSREISIMAGIQDADARELESVGDSIFRRDNFFVAAQVAWKRRWQSGDETLVQAMYWHTDGTSDSQTPSGDGVSALLQHQFKKHTTAFVRYSHSVSAATLAEQMVAAGVGWTPPGRADDLAGVAFAWGRPSMGRLRDQYVTELLYRLQVTPEFQLTPDLQFVLFPSQNPQNDFVVVLGLRARLAF
jgi:porin